VYNNTVFASPSAGASPSAIFVQQSAASDVFVRNNIFQTVDGAELVAVVGGQRNLTFQGNSYFTEGAAFQIHWEGATYAGLASWRTGSGQERLGERDVGSSVNPQLGAPGRGGTFGDTALLPTLDAYRLADDSPLIGAGLNLASLFRINPGATDFFGTALPRHGGIDVGAHQVERRRADRGDSTGRTPHE
jgi:hypothetical protein